VGKIIFTILHYARTMRNPGKLSDKFKINKSSYFFHTCIKLEFTDADAMDAYEA